MAKAPQGIIFDMGETILFRRKYAPLSGYNAILKKIRYKGNVTGDILLERSEKILNSFVAKARDKSTLELSFQNFLRYLFNYFEIDIKNHSFSKLEKIYNESTFKYVMPNGLIELLDTIDSLHIKKAVLSNSYYTENILKSDLSVFHIEKRFDFIISSADYCFRKPNPLIYDIAVKKMGIPAENIWFIGDRFQYDIVGANDSGLTPVWFNHAGRKKTAAFDFIEIKSLPELTSLLKS